MAYLSDTSIILRLNEPSNPISEVIEECLNKLSQAGEELVVVPQVLVEVWVVATRPKNVNGLGLTTDETEEILDNLQKLFTVLPENAQIFDEWKTLVIKHKVSGKPTHDARIAAEWVEQAFLN